MRTVVVTQFGDPEVLQPREAPEPRIEPGEVLIDVQVIEVLFLDTQLRAGWGKDYFPMRPPFVPGTGVGGTAGGRPVIARTGDEGAYAERVVVPVEEVFEVPASLDLAMALAALHDGVLALSELAQAQICAGSRVLATAAAGSTGHWFIPLAKAAGATVTGAAGGPAKVRAVRELGADVAIDYREPDWLDRAGGPFDVVFDGAGGELGRSALTHTADGGRFFAHGAASGEFAAQTGERGIELIGIDQKIGDDAWRRMIREGLALLAAGRVRPSIGQRVPLARAAEAHAAMQRREVIGKTILTV
jgi:NADPH2:quinone reductase